MRAAAELGVPERAVPVEPGISPVFRRGVRFPDAATVQPARLVRALRRAALAAGVELHERSRATSIRRARWRPPPAASAPPRSSSPTNAWMTRLAAGARAADARSAATSSSPSPFRSCSRRSAGRAARRSPTGGCSSTTSGRPPTGGCVMGSSSGPIGRGGADRRAVLRRRGDGRTRGAGAAPAAARSRRPRGSSGRGAARSTSPATSCPFFAHRARHADPLRRRLLAGTASARAGSAARSSPRSSSAPTTSGRGSRSPGGCRRVCRPSRSATSAAPPSGARSSRSRTADEDGRRAAPARPRRRRAPAPARPSDRDAVGRGSLPADAFALALGAAALHALWNVLLARTRDPQAATAAAFCMAVVIWAPVAAAAGGWRRAPGSTSPAAPRFELAYVLLLSAAYARAPLSVFYPIARGLAPVLVLVVAVLALGAATSWNQALGVCAVGARDPARPRPPARPRGDALRPGDRGDDRRLHADRQHRRHARRPARVPRGGDGRAGGR